MSFNRERVSCVSLMMLGLAVCSECEAGGLWCRILPLKGEIFLKLIQYHHEKEYLAIIYITYHYITSLFSPISSLSFPFIIVLNFFSVSLIMKIISNY